MATQENERRPGSAPSTAPETPVRDREETTPLPRQHSKEREARRDMAVNRLLGTMKL